MSIETVKLNESRQYKISLQTNFHVEVMAHYDTTDYDIKETVPYTFSVVRYVNDSFLNITYFAASDLIGAVKLFEDLKATANDKAQEYDSVSNLYLSDVMQQD